MIQIRSHLGTRLTPDFPFILGEIVGPGTLHVMQPAALPCSKDRQGQGPDWGGGIKFDLSSLYVLSCNAFSFLHTSRSSSQFHFIISQQIEMPSLRALAISLAGLATVAQTIPTVTPVLLTGGCGAYPSYDASTLIAGPWILQLNSCDNSTIEGYGDNSQLIRRSGDTGIHKGRVCCPSLFQCFSLLVSF